MLLFLNHLSVKSGLVHSDPFSLVMDGNSIGNTAAKTYFLETVDPGSHTIKSNDSTVTLDTQAGQNYFVWPEVKMGVMQAHAKLHIVDTTKGEAGVRNCTLAAE